MGRFDFRGGKIKVGRSDQLYHGFSRAASQLFDGPVHKQKIVTQTFRNRLGVNPEHLQLVEQVPLD